MIVMQKQISSILFGSSLGHSKLFDVCYSLFRIYAGLSIALGAGLSKAFHKINEKGDLSFDNLTMGAPEWFVKQVSEIGFTFLSPNFWAYLAIYGEFIGGLLIAVGLFTRLSSLQLAFQFFVVSFIWYNDPEPFTGMYYQQLIFWSFVITFGAGDGRYSLAQWFKNRSMLPRTAPSALKLTILLLLFGTMAPQAQTPSTNPDRPTDRVSFEVKNPTLRGMDIEFRSYYNTRTNKLMGAYGYSLNAMSSHAVNMVAPVRVYRTQGGKKTLILVINTKDEGKSFSLKNTYEISREDYLQAANDELNEETNKMSQPNESKSIEQEAQERGISLVTFRVKGSSIWPRQVYVRYQLPWDKSPKTMTGFSSTMSRQSTQKMRLPVGTKVYSCSGKYWEKEAQYTEKLIVTVDEEKNNYTFSL
jgi:uncharacterized membrane protein YphA (DoxX/SURF4 family)